MYHSRGKQVDKPIKNNTPAKQVKKQKCQGCPNQAGWFYQCACKPKLKLCSKCSVMNSQICPKCKRGYDRYQNQQAIVHDIKVLNNDSYHKSVITKSYKDKTLYKKKLQITGDLKNLYEQQSPNLSKKIQTDLRVKKNQIKFIQNRQQITSELMKKSTKNEYDQNQFHSKYKQRPLQSIRDQQKHFPQSDNKNSKKQLGHQKQFYPLPIKSNYSYLNNSSNNYTNKPESYSYTKKYQNKKEIRTLMPQKQQKQQYQNSFDKKSNNLQTSYQNLNYTKYQNQAVKQTPFTPTKEQQLREIKYNIEKKQGYFHTKCQRLYKLYQLTKIIDQVYQKTYYINLPECNCTLKKQFILSLFKDQCLICAKQCMFQSQRYQLKNGFCICNNCQTFIDRKDEDIKSYIKPLLFQCPTCQYSQIKKSKKQIHNPQNIQKDQFMICKVCFENSVKRQKRIEQQKQRKKRIEQEDRKRQEQNRRREEERQRIQLQNERKRQEIQRRNKQYRDNLQQENFRFQMQQINIMQQKEQTKIQKIQREQLEKKRNKQKQQKIKIKLQAEEKRKQNKQRQNQFIDNMNYQYEKQKKYQRNIRRTFQSQEKNSKVYQSRKCIACDRLLTHYQKGEQFDGVFVCSLCTTKNKYASVNSKRFVVESYARKNDYQRPQQKYKINIEEQKNQNFRGKSINQEAKQQYLFDYRTRVQKQNNQNGNCFNKKQQIQKVNKYIHQRTQQLQQQKICMINRKDINYKQTFSPIKQEVNRNQKRDNLIFPFQLLDNDKKQINKNISQFSQKETFKILNLPKEQNSTNRQSLDSKYFPNIEKQTVNKQQKDQNQEKLTCGICYDFINSIEKLGVKNQDRLILCKQCYNQQKQSIQNQQSSHIQKYSLKNQYNSSIINEGSPIQKDNIKRQQEKSSQKSISENIIQQNIDLPIKILPYLQPINSRQQFKKKQEEEKPQISNQPSIPKINNSNKSDLQNKVGKVKDNKIQEKKKKQQDIKKQQNQLLLQANFNHRKPQYQDVLTPSLKSDSAYHQKEQVQINRIKNLKKQEKLITNSNELLSMKLQQPIKLSQSLNRNGAKPQRDLSYSNESQHQILQVEKDNQAEQYPLIPFDAKQSKIPFKQFQQNDYSKGTALNPLENTQIEIHDMLIQPQKQQTTQKQKEISIIKQKKSIAHDQMNQQININKENQPILNKKLQILLQNQQNLQQNNINNVSCTQCQYMIQPNKAFCISQGQKIQQSNKIYLCIICYSKQYFETKRAQQIAKRSKSNNTKSRYQSKQKSKISNVNSSAIKSSSLKKDINSYNQKKISKYDSQIFQSKPTNHSVIIESTDSKILPTYNMGITSYDVYGKNLIESKLQKSPQTPQNNKNEKSIQAQKPIKIPEIQTKIEEKKQKKKKCQICRRQNNVLCFDRICLDCFKKQKLSASRLNQV